MGESWRDVDGLRIRYELSGPEGAPVVMPSHSLTASLGMWAPQMEALTAHYQVLRYDTRGHGGTEVTVPPYGMDGLGADAMALAEALGIAKVAFVGLSMGGMVAQTVALNRPDMISAVIIADSFCKLPDGMTEAWEQRIATATAKGMEALVAPTMDRWFSAGFQAASPDAVEPIRHGIRTTAVDGYVGCCRAIMGFDVKDRLGAITAPTLVICGRQDPSTPLAESETIAAHVPGAELVVLEDAQHLANIEQATAFNDTLLGFLGRHVA